MRPLRMSATDHVELANLVRLSILPVPGFAIITVLIFAVAVARRVPVVHAARRDPVGLNAPAPSCVPENSAPSPVEQTAPLWGFAVPSVRCTIKVVGHVFAVDWVAV